MQGDVLDGRSTLRRRRLPAVVVRLEVDAGQHVLRRHLHVGDGLCVLDDRRAQQLRGLRRQSQRGLASSREMCPAVLRLAVQVERRPLRDSDLLNLRIRRRSLDQPADGRRVREQERGGRIYERVGSKKTGDILVTDKTLSEVVI